MSRKTLPGLFIGALGVLAGVAALQAARAEPAPPSISATSDTAMSNSQIKQRSLRQFQTPQSHAAQLGAAMAGTPPAALVIASALFIWAAASLATSSAVASPGHIITIACVTPVTRTANISIDMSVEQA